MSCPTFRPTNVPQGAAYTPPDPHPVAHVPVPPGYIYFTPLQDEEEGLEGNKDGDGI